MPSLAVPAGGLTLTSGPTESVATDPAKTGFKPVQVMQLDLESTVLDDIIKNVHARGKELRLTFGKTTTLQYANKSHALFTTPNPSHGEIYSYSAEEKPRLSFAGLLSHKLAMKKAQDNLAGTDAALAMLQSQMASHQKDKQSKQIKFVPDGSNLPPPVQEKQATAKSITIGLHKKNNSSGRLINATTRSMPASPSIGASRSPASLGAAPTSVPVVRDEKTQKLQALRTPLIHLLAVRQVSVKFLAQKTCCSQEECKEVLQRVGRESLLDPEKWDLSDKSFKELDVWKFAYPSDVDRQFAIDRAVSAFDRMRVSREEKLWQMLLPKHERGKGKILSKLNLHTGPITPRINVQKTGDASQGHETGNDSDRKDRLAPSDAEPMARSKSHDQITKKRVSEKEAQSKRLLSKNPKKAAQAPKPKAAHPAVKKGPKKAAAASSSVPKSTEFVRDSDEDEDAKDALPPQSKPAPATTTTATGEAKKAQKPAVSKSSSAPSKPRIPENKASRVQKKPSVPWSKMAGNKPPSTSSSSSGSRSRLSDSSHNSSVPMTKTLSRQRNTSSPHKPSPLGSSPPTNASDFDNDNSSHPASSTSSTPLVAQSRRMNNNTPARLPGTTRPISQATNHNSDSSLKRKANDIDSDIHNHAPQLTNGQTNATKRPKTSILSPPTSDSSTASSPPPIRDATINLAQRFKMYYVKYETLYQEVTTCEDASQDVIDKVLNMHDHLVNMKDQIEKSVWTFCEYLARRWRLQKGGDIDLGDSKALGKAKG